jgi:enoyl-CoA hydratase/carnithine racemase
LAAFDFLEKLIMVSKPVVAGVDGLAIGIGTTMLMHCDHVVATDRSVFRTPFVDLGLVTEAGSSLIGPRIMGHHRAFSLLVLGEAMNADEARLAGLVNRIVEPGKLEAAAGENASKIAAKPADALRITRGLVRGDRSDVLARMRQEAELFEERLRSEEALAAFAAFMNRGQEKTAKES